MYVFTHMYRSSLFIMLFQFYHPLVSHGIYQQRQSCLFPLLLVILQYRRSWAMATTLWPWGIFTHFESSFTHPSLVHSFVFVFVLRIHPRWSRSDTVPESLPIPTAFPLLLSLHSTDLGPDLPKPSCLQGIFCIHFVPDCLWWDLIPVCLLSFRNHYKALMSITEFFISLQH